MKDDKKIDESLLGNEKIEEAIKLLQGECTQEMQAHTLTAVSYTHLDVYKRQQYSIRNSQFHSCTWYKYYDSVP